MIVKPNEDIRKLLKNNGIYQWEIAQKLGMQDTNFSRMLREELSDKLKEDIKKHIEKIIKERG